MSLTTLFLRASAALAAPGGGRGRLTVLIYHRVMAEPDPLTGEPDAATFDVHMKALRSCFNVVPLREAVAQLKAGTLAPRTAAITFDDGYADNLLIAQPILERHGLQATYFIASGYLDGGRMFNDSVIEAIRRSDTPTLDVPAVGLKGIPVGSVTEKRAAIRQVLRAVKYLDFDQRRLAADQVAHASRTPLPDDLMMTTEQLVRLARLRTDIGGHTVSHPILTRISDDRARDEIAANRKALTSITGQVPQLFAYPNGVPGEDYAPTHVQLVREAGYTAAVSTSWGAATRDCDLFQLPRFTPWDRDPKRFVARLVQNLVVRKPVILDASVGAAAAA